MFFEHVQDNIKEFGITTAIEHLFTEIVSSLKKFFPDCWQQLIILAYGRLVYIILNLLKKHVLNKKYSPADFLTFLAEVKMVKINDTWQRAPDFDNASP